MTKLSQRAAPQPEGRQPSAERPLQPCTATRRRAAKYWTIAAALTLAVTVLAVMAVACGGGGNGEEASPTPAAANGSPGPSPTVDANLPAACQALQSLKTYRYISELLLESPESTIGLDPGEPTPTTTITQEFLGDFIFEYNIDASFQAPDRTEAYVTGSTEPLSIITIGPQSWSMTTDTWKPSSRTIDLPHTPAIVCKAVLSAVDLTTVQPQQEKLNDVDATHYTFPQASIEPAITEIFGGGSQHEALLTIADVDVWLAEEDGWPARIEIRSTGRYADGRELRMHLLVEVKDANDDSIRVEPPS